ncbi:TetR/AcrR family transcriptional regulator [Neobacillus mesonae]|nr:TetR/AcrR family transcriptional regulator [Neobacillus mesonae]
MNEVRSSQSSAQRKLNASLLSLVITKGYSHITIADITEQAELSRATFYKYYQNKSELFQDLIANIQEGLLQSVIISFEHSKEIDFSHYPSMLPVLNYIEEHRDFFSYLFSRNVPSQLFLNFYSFLASSFTSEIVFKPKSNRLDADCSAQYLSLAFLSFMGYWVRSDFKYSAEELNEQLNRLHREKTASWYFSPSNEVKPYSNVPVREDRRVTRTRGAIKQGLLSLLQDQIPEEDIMIKNIAERADIRRATFYDYYSNKDELIMDMLDELGREMLKELNANSQGQDQQGLIESCDRLFKLIENERVLLRILKSPARVGLAINRWFPIFLQHYKAKQLSISFDKGLYNYYATGVILELILSRAGVIQNNFSSNTTAEQIVALIDQKEYELAYV